MIKAVRLAPIALLCSALALSGCGGKKTQTKAPPAPEVQDVRPGQSPGATQAGATQAGATRSAAGATGQSPVPPRSEIEVSDDAKVLFTEVGMASWYGPPYHNRRAANGEIFDMHQPTAAHRTLPLNSIVRVTNLKTGNQTVVRITDRGPFVADRVIDLSMAAAKTVDVWRPGTAKVRIEVVQAPKDLDKGGRWCVQVGKLTTEEVAAELQERLQRRYKTAKVLKFSGPMKDWWVRVRVVDDDRRRAEELIADNSTPEGKMYLVRID